MTFYLISFPSAAMDLQESEFAAAGRDSRAVIAEMRPLASTGSVVASMRTLLQSRSLQTARSPSRPTRRVANLTVG